MKTYIQHHPWQVIEEGFTPAYHEVSESLCSLGNGRFGVRGNFEEQYSGKSLRGSYFAGVYYPDLTRVGWWKNGYPEYFAKVLNSVNWIGVNIHIDGQPLDLHTTPVTNFKRILDMQRGVLLRTFEVQVPGKGKLTFAFERFCSMASPDTAAISIAIKSMDFAGDIKIEPYLDFDVHNKDTNYGDQFWTNFNSTSDERVDLVTASTKKTNFTVSAGMAAFISINNQPVSTSTLHKTDNYVGRTFNTPLNPGDEITYEKYVANISSLYEVPEVHADKAAGLLNQMKKAGYASWVQQHEQAWKEIWSSADIIIDGNVTAQQGIRFNIFHLWQTYTGEDARLNIGPKGFTGEKYGGSTYWDTEAYCIPFYLSTADPRIARNLLVYRYLHLPKAIENAAKLGFKDGAALYPMVTINGEECHNEWEITFEEIHRNGAIVYAIYDYIRYTGDTSYLFDGGLEVMIGVARFWKQRFNYSGDKQAFVMLGVTGPNEYENNINNNWYTNYIARWCMQYALDQLELAKSLDSARHASVISKTGISEEETLQWQSVIDNVYFPYDEYHQVYLQQDGFMDKELIPVSQLPAVDRPLNQKWSWDRILRSCFIKQADVLQGMYFFEDHFDEDTHRRHFDFYEPMTVHESSLSPCVHAILASRLGKKEKANEMYLRTSRLDLDDYNNDTEDGLHITSMAGTWMSVVRGFAGLQVRDNELNLAPVLPEGWNGFSFHMHFRGRILAIEVQGVTCRVTRIQGEPLDIVVAGERKRV
jgi:maltose phosphorylase